MAGSRGPDGKGRYGKYADPIIAEFWHGPGAKTSYEIASIIEAKFGGECSYRWVQNRAQHIGLKRDDAFRAKNLMKGRTPRASRTLPGVRQPYEYKDEGPPKAADWPEFKGCFADVGRADLIREMLPLSRFCRMPYLEPRYSGSGCAAALC